MTKIIQSTEKNRSLWNRQIRDSTTKIETSFPWKIATQIAQVLCRKASATRIPGKDHWHQTAVTTFTENGPFQDYIRKTVNSQINVSFSPAPIWLSLSLLNLKYYLTYQKKICLNKSFCLTMVLYFAIISQAHEAWISFPPPPFFSKFSYKSFLFQNFHNHSVFFSFDNISRRHTSWIIRVFCVHSFSTDTV